MLNVSNHGCNAERRGARPSNGLPKDIAERDCRILNIGRWLKRKYYCKNVKTRHFGKKKTRQNTVFWQNHGI